MKRNEPKWKRKLATKMVQQAKIWDALQGKQHADWKIDDAGYFYAHYIPIMRMLDDDNVDARRKWWEYFK